MASIERTAYPRFKRFMSVRELHVFYTPQPDEIVWAGEAAGSDEHLLALVTQLKVFNSSATSQCWMRCRRRWSGTFAGTCGCRKPPCRSTSTRTAERHRKLVRARSEVVYDPAGARKLPDGRMTRPI